MNRKGEVVSELAFSLPVICLLLVGMVNLLFLVEAIGSSLVRARNEALVAAERPGRKELVIQPFEVDNRAVFIGRVPYRVLPIRGKGVRLHAAVPREEEEPCP